MVNSCHRNQECSPLWHCFATAERKNVEESKHYILHLFRLNSYTASKMYCFVLMAFRLNSSDFLFLLWPRSLEGRQRRMERKKRAQLCHYQNTNMLVLANSNNSFCGDDSSLCSPCEHIIQHSPCSICCTGKCNSLLPRYHLLPKWYGWRRPSMSRGDPK